MSIPLSILLHLDHNQQDILDLVYDYIPVERRNELEKLIALQDLFIDCAGAEIDFSWEEVYNRGWLSERTTELFKEHLRPEQTCENWRKRNMTKGG